MSARQATNALQHAVFTRTGISLGFDDANTLRRAERTLHRWAELECGDGHGCIERDGETGVPYYYRSDHSYLDSNDPRAYHRIADKEAGALRRIAEVCTRTGLHFYHQTDPRGCALYVSSKPLQANDYSGAGVACCE